MKTLQDKIDQLTAASEALAKLIAEETAILDKRVKEHDEIKLKIRDLLELKQSQDEEKAEYISRVQEAFTTFLLTAKTGAITYSDMQDFAEIAELTVPDEFREPDEEPDKPAAEDDASMAPASAA